MVPSPFSKYETAAPSFPRCAHWGTILKVNLPPAGSAIQIRCAIPQGDGGLGHVHFCHPPQSTRLRYPLSSRLRRATILKVNLPPAGSAIQIRCAIPQGMEALAMCIFATLRKVRDCGTLFRHGFAVPPSPRGKALSGCVSFWLG